MVSGNPPSAITQQTPGVSYIATRRLLENGQQMSEQILSFSSTSKCLQAQWSTSSTTRTVELSVERNENGQSSDLTPLTLHGVSASGMTASIDVPQDGALSINDPFYASLSACNDANPDNDPAVKFQVNSS